MAKKAIGFSDEGKLFVDDILKERLKSYKADTLEAFINKFDFSYHTLSISISRSESKSGQAEVFYLDEDRHFKYGIDLDGIVSGIDDALDCLKRMRNEIEDIETNLKNLLEEIDEVENEQ